MKNLIFYITGGLFIIAFIFGVFAFIEFTLDASEWGKSVRTKCSFLAGLFLFGYSVLFMAKKLTR